MASESTDVGNGGANDAPRPSNGLTHAELMRKALAELDETKDTNAFQGAEKGDESHLWFKKIKAKDPNKLNKFFSWPLSGLQDGKAKNTVSGKCSQVADRSRFKSSLPEYPLSTRAELEQKYLSAESLVEMGSAPATADAPAAPGAAGGAVVASSAPVAPSASAGDRSALKRKIEELSRIGCGEQLAAIVFEELSRNGTALELAEREMDAQFEIDAQKEMIEWHAAQDAAEKRRQENATGLMLALTDARKRPRE